MFKKWICQNRNWVFQNFPFLENDFDALTDYELFCKMVEYAKSLAISNEKFISELKNDLDTMYNEGKFDSLIMEIINLQTTFTFDSVSDMKLATNLVDGSYARTSGYYSYNDNGGAFYKIRNITSEDTIDEASIISLYDENLIAELIPLDYITPEMFGCVGDGTRDDTTNLLKALNYGKIIKGTKTYLADFGGSLYVTGSTTNNILLDGGIYNLSGRLDYTNDIIIKNTSINGDVYFTGNNFTGNKVIIKNNKFNVGELTFRLNNTDFDSVYIENNYVNFYGTFWSSSQAIDGTSLGNVYIKNNEFVGKSVLTQTESYYCSCVVENDYVEFSHNYCHDFVINDATKSVHDGYFSSNYVYVHDNIVKNLSGGLYSNNALLKAKAYGVRYFYNNDYEITSDTYFPFLQVQASDSEWHIENCNFKIKNATTTDISNSDNIYINNCNFEITNLYDLLMKNSYYMNNCNINVNKLYFTNVLTLNNGKITNTNINVNEVDSSITNYGCIYGYTNTNNLLDNVISNINLIYYQFLGTIKNCLIKVLPNTILGQLVNCYINSRNIVFYDSSNYNYNVSIIEDGSIYGKSFSSSDTFDYIDTDEVIRIAHTTANSNGLITLYSIPNDYSKVCIINLLRQ